MKVNNRRSRRKKRTRRNNHVRGGGTTNSTTTRPIALQSYPLQPGTSSQRESAMQTSKLMNAKQQSLINKQGGGNRKSKKSKIRFLGMRGGNSCSVPKGPVIVPSFSNSGNKASPINANTTSALSNSINMQAGANACNDCYATGTCKGGGKRRKSSSRKVQKKHATKYRYR